MASQIAVQSGLMSPFSRISSNSEIFSSGTILALNFTRGGSSFPDFVLQKEKKTSDVNHAVIKIQKDSTGQSTQTTVGDEVLCQQTASKGASAKLVIIIVL